MFRRDLAGGKPDTNAEIADVSVDSLPGFQDNSSSEIDKEKLGSSTPIAPQPADGKRDEALDLVSSYEGGIMHISPEQNAQLLRKIDRNLMPIMFVIYFLQLADKQVLSFASVFGISRDTDLVGEDYSILGSMLYIAQVVAQPISAYILVRLRLSKYIPAIVTCWGATLACMAAAHNFRGLLAARFFLGACEASITPAFILITQFWYRRHEQGIRQAIWFSNYGWVNIFGSLIVYGLGHIKSKSLHSYQIMFLLLGAITCLVGLLSFFIFPDNPVRCKFLTKEEKIMAIERLRANQQGVETKEFKINQVIEMLCDLKSWCWMLLAVALNIPGGGILAFGPLIMNGFGFDGYDVTLLLIPYGAMQIISLIIGFWASRRFGVKAPVVIGCLLPAVAACVVLLRVGRDKEDQPALVIAFYLLGLYNAASPTLLNWQASNVAGHTKKTTSTALVTAGIIGGNIIGPLLFSPKDKPYYHRGIVVILRCYAASAVIVCITVVYLWHLNEWNRKRRLARGKAGKIVDYSMLSAQDAEKIRLDQDASGPSTRGIGNHAFEDLTDLQNDEFIYVY
ncbi:hypothetical protein NLJ89_g8358 [Agrocybe chaxingu]|uniref:Major facilitator superfamily (MFS) profile domain-containing protein n=1 Tax=Agrocybe chaxingu TaxID=84603 RepID=A0A9W8JVE6_9AGAR|nr:hypothetical protein NLJ89_g8358 [Agrocybe chaxingu]